MFRKLEANDIVFIDSTHVVSMDSDVLHECLRILPELAPGVLVHFHDIFTPLDYPEKFVTTNLCFWGEYRVPLRDGRGTQGWLPEIKPENKTSRGGTLLAMG